MLALLAVLEGLSISGERIMLGITTTLFFACYSLGLLWCALGLWRRRSWARGPVLLTQLIQLGVAWSLWNGQNLWLVVMLAVTALLVGAGVLNPASMAALEEAD